MSDDIVRSVKEALKEVLDPELGYNVVDLGLVYDVDVEDGHARILLTTTTKGCPATAFIRDGVETRAASVPGITAADVTMTWEPPWSPDCMSDEAKAHFGVGTRRTAGER
ncbi:MAG: metal-sulfur cluster assembly factor [Alphaproteobacteria bacterium]|nr:metal-sulfur cluster assembly factor [Alphaproteobacteria bacterium]MDE2630459.1 metal-sulfur cluster assembly factor [Alphaproteobacteria bacterium]